MTLKPGDLFKFENGTVGRVDAIDGYGNVSFYRNGILRSCSIARVQKLEMYGLEAEVETLTIIGNESERLRADNARLAESMAKLEDAIGLMRETVAEQNKIIAEQARELYRFRCVK